MTSQTTTMSGLLQNRRTGIVLMILGALLVIAGILQTTSATHDVDATCPSGTTLVAKFNRAGNFYIFEKPSGNQSIVTITNGSKSGGNWSSTVAISVVIVKGGTNSHLTSLNPPQTSGSFSNAGLPNQQNGKKPDVSNVQFCKPNTPPTTSTSTSTTTTVAPTTTTAAPTTTTTVATTTTTAPAPTTTIATTGTTVPAPTTTTTTVPPTTTTVSVTSTTVADSTTTTLETGATTTTVGVTGTTVSGGSVTTTTDPTTSTSTAQAGSATAVVTSTSIQATRTESEGTLPRTGSSSSLIMALGLLLFGTGAALTVVSLRRNRHSRT